MSKELSRTLKDAAGKVKLLFDPGVVPLNQAIELEERPPSKSLSQLVYAICGFVVLAVAMVRVDARRYRHQCAWPRRAGGRACRDPAP